MTSSRLALLQFSAFGLEKQMQHTLKPDIRYELALCRKNRFELRRSPMTFPRHFFPPFLTFPRADYPGMNLA